MTFDACGDQASAGTRSYAYDALGRLTADAPSAVGIAFAVAVTRPHLAFARYLTGLLGRPTVNPGEVLGWHLSWPRLPHGRRSHGASSSDTDHRYPKSALHRASRICLT